MHFVRWATCVFKAAVDSVAPGHMIGGLVRYNEASDTLNVCNYVVELLGRTVYVVGTGKAAAGMAVAMQSIMKSRIKDGLMSIPRGQAEGLPSAPPLKFYEGATSNLPDEDSALTTERIVDLAAHLDEKDVLIVLISGGGSALLSLPCEGLTVQAKRELCRDLARAGADITEMNSVRKKLSRVKGGRLAAIAAPAQVVSLILSDIVDDPVDLIASGPTVKDREPPNQALHILKKFGLENKLPPDVLDNLKNPNTVAFPEDKVTNYLIGTNKRAVKAAARAAKNANWYAVEVTSSLTGDVREIGPQYLQLVTTLVDLHYGNISLYDAKESIRGLPITRISTTLLASLEDLGKCSKPCLIIGGETTVEVRGSGKGGRSQQLALEFSQLLESWSERERRARVQLLCGGTDGIDGPTTAAGAIGTSTLVREARKQGLDPDRYRNDNDSFNFFQQVSGGKYLLRTGHTGTNVADIHILSVHYPNVS